MMTLDSITMVPLLRSRPLGSLVVNVHFVGPASPGGAPSIPT